MGAGEIDRAIVGTLMFAVQATDFLIIISISGAIVLQCFSGQLVIDFKEITVEIEETVLAKLHAAAHTQTLVGSVAEFGNGGRGMVESPGLRRRQPGDFFIPIQIQQDAASQCSAQPEPGSKEISVPTPGEITFYCFHVSIVWFANKKSSTDKSDPSTACPDDLCCALTGIMKYNTIALVFSIRADVAQLVEQLIRNQ